MIDTNQREAIKTALKEFNNIPFVAAANNFFAALGYASDRSLPIATPQQFREQLDPNGILTDRESESLDKLNSLHLLFQLTDTELVVQSELFDAPHTVQSTEIKSYLFFAAELPPGHYPRSMLATLVRAVNKPLLMPVLIIFKHGNTVSIGIIHRRPHKRNLDADVLEKVTLIKDIRFANPHRAHIEILYDLSLAKLCQTQPGKEPITNFNALHRAWLKTLDTSELNSNFYKKIANWYFWALDHVKFPKKAPKDANDRDAFSLIRLLTRLIFCWFVKEKKLIPEALFNEQALNTLLKGFAPGGAGCQPSSGIPPPASGIPPPACGSGVGSLPTSGLVSSMENHEQDAHATYSNSVYYKAILQNLFFATLNTEMNMPGEPPNRRFSNQQRDDHMIHTVWRYENCIADVRDFQSLFKNIPFLNGGLFDCMMTVRARRKYVLMDFPIRRKTNPLFQTFCFSATNAKSISAPLMAMPNLIALKSAV